VTKATAAKAPPRGAKAAAAAPTRGAKAATAPATTAEHPTLTFVDATAWATWLTANHASARGVWIRMAKKA
jgi:hypothetical protein